mmetsp:Transcript_20024/g.46823  ORF Transcript_20024/g.46823 Transcript_20024/m.46823 type:complete len:331 (+) Transcript_20024:995-1987(+)
MGLFLDLHRILQKGVRSGLLFLQGFLGLYSESLSLLREFLFLEKLGLQSEFLDKQHVSVLDLLFLHGQEFLQAHRLPLGSLLQISRHLHQPHLELRAGHAVEVETHEVYGRNLGELRVGFRCGSVGFLVEGLFELLDFGQDLGLIEVRGGLWCRGGFGRGSHYHGQRFGSRCRWRRACFLLGRGFRHNGFCHNGFGLFGDGLHGRGNGCHFRGCFAHDIGNDFVDLLELLGRKTFFDGGGHWFRCGSRSGFFFRRFLLRLRFWFACPGLRSNVASQVLIEKPVGIRGTGSSRSYQQSQHRSDAESSASAAGVPCSFRCRRCCRRRGAFRL